jgi:hypothetical protein
MNTETKTKPKVEERIADTPVQPCQTLLVRRGRGRTGGSTGLDLWIQRARDAGRRVKPLDGDLRSRTLSTLYPATDAKGRAIQDGAGSPRSEEMMDMRDWLSAELDSMIENGTSAVLDLGGGDRVVQEYVRELEISEFCADHGIRLVEAFFLGPDQEDFRHVLQILDSRDLKADATMFVLNEGVIRQGQTTEGVFDTLMTLPAFKTQMNAGVRPVFMRRLSCMGVLRERGLGFYDAVDGKLDRDGKAASPTLRHMVKTWLRQNEQDHKLAGTFEWLP